MSTPPLKPRFSYLPPKEGKPINDRWMRWFQSQMDLHGLTQDDLARITGASQSTISRWASGSRMEIKYAVELARIFAVPIHQLLEIAGYDMRGVPTGLPSEPHDDLEIKMAQMRALGEHTARSLPEPWKRRILEDLDTVFFDIHQGRRAEEARKAEEGGDPKAEVPARNSGAS